MVGMAESEKARKRETLLPMFTALLKLLYQTTQIVNSGNISE